MIWGGAAALALALAVDGFIFLGFTCSLSFVILVRKSIFFDMAKITKKIPSIYYYVSF
jgi:hypothetical protein